MAVPGYYDFRLVALSVVLAFFSSYAALDLAGRVTAAQHRLRFLWLCGGAAAMGFGIWSMHYIGMLAFTMPMVVFYHVPTVLLSLLAAMSASAVALFVVSRQKMGIVEGLAGSLVMGGGIAAMHYIGMAAMRLPAVIRYSGPRVLLSVVLAIVVSLVALVLSFRARGEGRGSVQKLLSALLMAAAIPLMHYTGMWAATFSPSTQPVDTTHAVGTSPLGIAAISISSFFILIVAIGTAFLDRLLAAKKANLDDAYERESQFHTMAEALPQIIWTARPDGSLDFYNQRWFDYTGLTPEQSAGWGWKPILHPEDLTNCLEKWEHAVQTGSAYEVEYRFRRASDGSFRWHLGRAMPIRNANAVITKWFGTCTDIDDQKRHVEILEAQILERTAALVEANAHLEKEIEVRALAQQKFNDHNERALHELTQLSKKRSLLAKMGEMLQSCSTTSEAIAVVLGFAVKVFPDFRGALLLLNDSPTFMEVMGTWLGCSLFSGIFERNSCWALRTGHRYAVDDGDQNIRCAHIAPSRGAFVCLPIMAQGQSLGIVHFEMISKVETFSAEDFALISTFADQLGLSLANIKLQEALRNQSIRDPLTGLFNRRHLQATLERELLRATRTKSPVGLIMFDLDHFKNFNDTYGHPAGDSILREVAVLLSSSIRGEDVACRYGGEEFLVVLPGAGIDIAQGRAEEMRRKVKELAITHDGSPLGPLTISAGVAVFPAHGKLADRVLAAADQALYRAKKEGRDRVITAELEPEAQAASAGKA